MKFLKFETDDTGKLCVGGTFINAFTYRNT